jgi:hypothetical protein
MVSEGLSLLPFLALTLWRFVFTGMEWGWPVGGIDALRPQHNDLPCQSLPFDRSSLPVVAGQRAQNYLRRIVALTGATQKGNCCFLDVDKTQFCVRSGHVTRLRDVTDPKRACEETCFYPAYKDMPKAEQIASALLQLKNNPALFDSWAVERSLAFKADGQVFTRTQRSVSDEHAN